MSDALRDIFKNEVIRASAGTGKTFELSNRFLKLLASGAECETILATTFTRKGAGEILDRIVQRLAKAALSESATNELAEQLEWKLDQRRVQDLLRELIQNLHRLQIGTLDAFFYRIAQSFRLELGLPTQWQIVNEQQISALENRVVHEILRDKAVVSLLHLMTKGDAQRRIADLIRSTVRNLYEVARQSDREAWNRLELPPHFSFDRNFDLEIEQLLAIEYPHKSQRTQIEKEIQIVQDRDWLTLADSKIVNKIAVEKSNSYYKPLPPECLKIYHKLIDHCRGVVIDMLIRKNSSTYDLLDKFGQHLEREKTESGQLRFDDITIRLEDFIKGRETDEFSFRLDHNVNHLLLDEFQDTSISQWRVVEPFALRTTEEDTRKSFFCVGDLKQAIFSWRGGVAEIFDTVENNLTNMAESRHLTKSYRSSPVIMESVNMLFGNLDRYSSDNEVVASAIARWSERFEEHETALSDLPGYFALEFAADSDTKNYFAKNSERNFNAVEATIQRVLRLHEEMPGKTIGVLVRKNETIGELIYKLRDVGVAASEEGGNPLTDSAAVETILALATLADHPGDSIARFMLSHSPLADSLKLEPETKLNQATNVQAAHQSSALLRNEISSLGYGFAFEKYARVLARHCTRRELARLQQLVQEAFNYEKANDQPRTKLRPGRFVDYIRNEFKASDESSAQVRVMTIHQSKGLEFDIVVLPMLFEQQGWFSHQSTVVVGREHPTEPINLVCRLANQGHRGLLPAEFQEAFDESKRQEVIDALCVLYVAMTRAVHATHVVMSYGCKPDQLSSAGVLLSSLYSGERKEGVAFSLGDANWKNSLPDESSEERSNAGEAYYLPMDATISNVEILEGCRSGRGIESVTPSSLEGGSQVKMSSIFATISNARSLEMGSYFHHCFEKVVWLDEAIPSRSVLKEHLLQKGPLPKKFDALSKRFAKLLEQPETKQLLSRQPYLQNYASQRVDESTIFDALRVEVANERTFAVRVDGKLMKGTIDRLVLVYEGDRLLAADIIDYKTDEIRKANLPAKIENYRPQLLAYQSAVAKFTRLPISRISARLLFLNSDLVVDIDESKAGDVEEEATPVRPPKFKNQQKMFWPED